MLLTIDIGNSHTSIGIFENDSIVNSWRILTNLKVTWDELYIIINNLLDDNFKSIDDVIICSVVPQLDKTFTAFSKKYLNITPHFIKYPKTKCSINLKIENPYELGADRIVNAEAGYLLYGGNLIIIDSGTATNFDIILDNGDYIGGAISPGIENSSRALFESAAKLFPIDVTLIPDKVVGDNTHKCLLSGIINGYAYMIHGFIKSIKKELNLENCKVLITGGYSTLIKKMIPAINYIDKELTLKGLKIIYDNNL